MTAVNQEYADLWNRVQAKQEARRKSAECERALEIVEAQRRRDYDEYLNDPCTLLRMYGDKDTRVYKLYDADNPGVVQTVKDPEPTEEAFHRGILYGIAAVGAVVSIVLVALAALMM